MQHLLQIYSKVDATWLAIFFPLAYLLSWSDPTLRRNIVISPHSSSACVVSLELYLSWLSLRGTQK